MPLNVVKNGQQLALDPTGNLLVNDGLVNFPQVVDMGDAGSHVAAAFIGGTQTTPKGAKSLVVQVVTGASTATWQPIIDVSMDGGTTWLRTHPVPTSVTASSVTANWSFSCPVQAFNNFGAAGATIQVVANVNMQLAPLWRIEYNNSAATNFSITSAKAMYN